MAEPHVERADAESSRAIPRPDITVAQIVLLILSQRGSASFQDITSHPATKSLGMPRTENSFYTALARLKRRRLIDRTNRRYELTAAGQYAALKAYVRKEFTEMERKPTTLPKWDGRWRLVLFDIPETKRSLRDYARAVLKRLGCKEFQRSTWIYPFKVPPFILKMLADPQLRKYAKVITTYDIDYDEDLRRLFRLT
jgi:DNA-binding transcriptional regulator PaaX